LIVNPARRTHDSKAATERSGVALVVLAPVGLVGVAGEPETSEGPRTPCGLAAAGAFLFGLDPQAARATPATTIIGNTLV
jgi:hypothetical protein